MAHVQMREAIPGIHYDDLHSVAKLSSEAHYKDVMKVSTIASLAPTHTQRIAAWAVLIPAACCEATP